MIKVSTWSPGSPSLGSAAIQASVIVHGFVQTVHFVGNPSGGMPQMTASIGVRDVGKGSVAGTTIVVRQSGGPVARPGNRGALVRLEDEELILPGDEVVLLLTRSQGPTPEYQPVYGAGVQFVRSGKFSGESAKRYGVDGESFEGMWRSVTYPQIPVGAFPLRSSGN